MDQRRLGGERGDSRGNQLKSSDGRELSYLVFDLPDVIKSSSAGVTATGGFEYGPNHERVVRKNYPNVYGVVGSANETTHYLGGAEVHRRASGVEVKRYVGGVLIVQTANGISKNYHWFDHQGSVVAVTNDAGVPVGTEAQMAYDAFGLRRETAGNDFGLSRLLNFNTQATTRHGYTGHEMVDEVGLIHMNGHMYDPRIARFIQADPMIQDPMNSQSLNRYSYVMNNPLNATDPTGMTAIGGFLSMLGSMFGGTDCPSCHYTPGSGGTFIGISQLGGQTVLNSITIPPGTVDSAFTNIGSEVIAPNPKNEYIDHYRLFNDAQLTLSVLQSDRPSKFFSAAELYEQHKSIGHPKA